VSALPLYSRKPRRKRIGPEACLQMAVVQHLMLRRTDGVIYFSIPNEGKRTEAEGARLKNMGMLPGIADLCLIIRGEVHFLELKARGQGRSADQFAFYDMCMEHGIPCACVDNINDALAQLCAWGALKPDRSLRRAA
jgi:hypothetical protein